MEKRLDILTAGTAVAERLRRGRITEIREGSADADKKPVSYRDEDFGWTLHRDATHFHFTFIMLTAKAQNPAVLTAVDAVAKAAIYQLGGPAELRGSREGQDRNIIHYSWPVKGAVLTRLPGRDEDASATGGLRSDFYV